METEMLEPTILKNLQDAGCSPQLVERYCELEARQCSIQMWPVRVPPFTSAPC